MSTGIPHLSDPRDASRGAVSGTLAPTAERAALAGCPFHDGLATLDLLLAELDPHEKALFDAGLDLRALCAAGDDAAACLEQLFRVRSLLDQRHYLAFYRVRCWARRALRIEVRPCRTASWVTRELPLDCARLDELVNSALADLAAGDNCAPAAHVRFAFAAPSAGCRTEP